MESEAVVLTRAEFSIVEYLAHQREKWVPHEELAARVLNANLTYDSALVRVHLLKIRRKLGPLAELLVTQRGRGTRLLIHDASWV
jgi:DNA-binding response OmpR family regulator